MGPLSIYIAPRRVEDERLDISKQVALILLASPKNVIDVYKETGSLVKTNMARQL